MRFPSVIERFKALGYTDDDIPNDDDEWLKLVRLPYPLTEIGQFLLVILLFVDVFG